MTRAFEDHITIPEKFGTVMVIEKEFGPSGARDWAAMARSVVNIVKVTFGTAALYEEKLLKDKIAAYNEAGNLESLVEDLLDELPGIVESFEVIVVDDGSTDSTYERIKDIAGIRILRHRSNRGKGAALVTGFSQAEKTSAWAITLDADGQHDPEDIPRFLACAQARPGTSPASRAQIPSSAGRASGCRCR